MEGYEEPPVGAEEEGVPCGGQARGGGYQRGSSKTANLFPTFGVYDDQGIGEGGYK